MSSSKEFKNAMKRKTIVASCISFKTASKIDQYKNCMVSNITTNEAPLDKFQCSKIPMKFV
jgi:hypothetical protein